MGLRLLIIADDLSGAADCALGCVRADLSVSVCLDHLDRACASDVLAVDCDTRHLPSPLAAERIAHVLEHHLPDGELLIFKKLDSTLRGNVAAELAAVLKSRRKVSAAHRRIVAIVAPAFPAVGRTTVGGQQFVHGTVLHESESGKHLRSSSAYDIRSMFANSGLCTVEVGLEVVRAGSVPLWQTFTRLSRYADVLVCDAETDEDLRAIAQSSLKLGHDQIWAGSAGLAYHLPEAAGLFRRNVSERHQTPVSGPTLIVIGSTSHVVRQQIQVLSDVSAMQVAYFPLPMLLDGPQAPAWMQQASNLEHMLQQGRDVAIVLEPGEQLSMDEGRRLTGALGTMMAPHVNTVGALLASGGETARAILDAWHVKSLRVIAEIEPGLPFSVTDGPGRQVPIITKAGAFGNSKTLLHCLDFLNSLKRGTEIL